MSAGFRIQSHESLSLQMGLSDERKRQIQLESLARCFCWIVVLEKRSVQAERHPAASTAAQADRYLIITGELQLAEWNSHPCSSPRKPPWRICRRVDRDLSREPRFPASNHRRKMRSTEVTLPSTPAATTLRAAEDFFWVGFWSYYNKILHKRGSEWRRTSPLWCSGVGQNSSQT